VNIKRWLKLLCVLALGTLLLSACGGSPAGGTTAWIDVPVDGLTFPSLQLIKIEGHAASSGGISRVEIWINGVLLTTINDPPMEGGLAAFHAEWIPSAPGEYTIQAVAFGADGATSEPDTTRIKFGEVPAGEPDLAIVSVEAIIAGDKEGIPFCNTRVVYANAGSEAIPADFSIQFSFDGIPQETVSVAGGLPPGASAEAVFIYQFVDMHYIGINLDSGSLIAETNEGNNAFAEARACGEIEAGPTPVPTLTITPGTSAVVQFWADPAEIEAGACTTIRWHVENVQRVIFGGLEQPFDGSYGDCLCGNQRYTLTVTHLDGTEEKRTVDISVTGSCDTPTVPPPEPEVDTTPPAAPSPAVPADGLEIACKGSQSLVWLPVDDPSGIAEYQVEVQRHSGDNNWQAAPGGSISVSDKTTSIPVE